MPELRLPAVTGHELLAALEKDGFEIARQRGSHVQVRREESNGTTRTFPVPVHSGRTIKKGTLKGILRLAGMDVERLLQLL
jgi:predicted RNA binding protein YcfA (HicA-like mRNA interferase family)